MLWNRQRWAALAGAILLAIGFPIAVDQGFFRNKPHVLPFLAVIAAAIYLGLFINSLWFKSKASWIIQNCPITISFLIFSALSVATILFLWYGCGRFLTYTKGLSQPPKPTLVGLASCGIIEQFESLGVLSNQQLKDRAITCAGELSKFSTLYQYQQRDAIKSSPDQSVAEDIQEHQRIRHLNSNRSQHRSKFLTTYYPEAKKLCDELNARVKSPPEMTAAAFSACHFGQLEDDSVPVVLNGPMDPAVR